MEIKKRGVILLFIILAIVLSAILFDIFYNSPPTIEKTSFIPEILYTDYNLKGNIEINDVDDEFLETHFIWYKNNIKLFEEIKKEQKSDEVSYSVLNNQNFSKNDLIFLETYVSDGKKESKHETIEIPVQNSPPEQPILIQPKDYTTEENNNIEFEYKSIDKDDDKITYALYINDIIQKTTSDKKTILNLKEGEYTWKIIASDGTQESSSQIYHLKIGKKEIKEPIKKESNKVPKLIKKIENQSWDIFGFRLNAFNLNDYFKDEDNDLLTFDVEGNSNITVLILDDGRVSFLQSEGWYGTEHVIFTASDTITKTKSNIVGLNVGETKIKDHSLCPGPCCDISCGKITKNCSDGSIASCDMLCVNGRCIPCSPDCGDIYEAPAINLPVASGEDIIDEMPCIDINITKKEKLVTIKDIGLLKKQIPEGYEIITGPFSLDCDGSTDVTLNIPSNYNDIQALKCEKDQCYSTLLIKTSELKCGGEIIKRTLRQQLYLEPKLMPIKIKEQTVDLKENILLYDQRIKVNFYGDIEDAKVSLRMPSKPIKEASNPSLKIVTTPIILRIEGTSSPNAIISMPYFISKRIVENSISFYVRKEEEWKPLGGTINKEDKIIEINIKDIKQYANENNEVILTLMGVISDYNLTSSFTKEYEPIQESRDMIVLVHGLASSPATYQELIDDIILTNQPYHVYALSHSSYQSINETANELIEHLEINSKQYENIYIIAHSLGGVIAQKALYDAYTENKKDKTKYSFIKKVRKAILASPTNEGSPVVEFYYELFGYLVNQDSPFTLYELNSAVIKDLTQGLIVPRVPAISYYVIAGTRTYPFFEGLEKITGDLFNNQPNDGIITVKNAQHIGNTYLNKFCENYWEFNLTHTETIDDERARKVILSIIAEDKFTDEEIPFMGNNKYFELQLDDCEKDDSFIIIGKKIKSLPAYKIFCGTCGDSYCSTRENILNCPSDCAKLNKNRSFLIIILVISGIIIFSLIVILIKKIRKKELHNLQSKRLIKHLAKNFDLDIKGDLGHEHITSSLVKNGWDKEVISKTFNSIIKKLGILPERIQTLRKEYSDKEIIRILTEEGWKKELIKKIIEGEEIKLRFSEKKKESEKKKKFSFFGFID